MASHDTGKKISLTGIKPSGSPHIGNYVGMIRPALELANRYDARYFIADYHALNTVKESETLRKFTYEIAAVWLACGLDPDKVLFYRQSDVPEVFELTAMLMCFTAKGRLNGAHAYKAAVQENLTGSRDADHGINAGLFTYPVLMAADILLFDAHYVPVGKDQIQHIEITADIAQAMSRNYGKDLFVIPEAVSEKEKQLIVGTDGRKMSKSYSNVIPIFAPEKKLRKIVMGIVTNSQSIAEPKDPDQCHVFALYKLFASLQEQEQLAARYRSGGMGWGEAKEELFSVLNREFAKHRSTYTELIDNKGELDRLLKEGAHKAREIAAKKIGRLRKEIGV